MFMSLKNRLAGEIKWLRRGLWKGSLSRGPVTGQHAESKQLSHMQNMDGD